MNSGRNKIETDLFMNMLYRYAISLIVIFALPAMATAQPASALNISVKADPRTGTIIVHFINPGSGPIRLWKGPNSWSWDNVRFIIIRDHVSSYFRRDPEEIFTRNIPAYDEVSEHKSLDRVFSVFDGSWVASKNAPKQLEKGDTIICVYAVNPTPEAAKYEVWVGTACGMSGAKVSP